MNEHLQERFSRSRKVKADEASSRVEVTLLPPKLNTLVREYYEQQPDPSLGGHWLARPEIPTCEELMDTDTNSASSSDIVEIAANKPAGAFESKEDYLGTQYELLREDALMPLREAVCKVKKTPLASEDQFGSQIGIYEKVHICAITMSTRGIAVRVTFSLRRTGKKILWEQSKRLISGSLVVLTPKNDMFNAKAIVAVVAARPLDGVNQNPPEIDLFFARAEELEIDPAVEYVMIEERSGFFEADRHTLAALQHMMTEKFPLSQHLVNVRADTTKAPEYLADAPEKDLSSVLIDNDNTQQTYANVDIINDWPQKLQSETEMDASQLTALRSMLSHRLAIVQGPPGTGKTFVSVQAVKIMLANWKEGDPPIIIVSQTNHAIDQFLRHVAQFEENFVRLGGRSKDRDVIKKRTLYEVRSRTSENPPHGSYTFIAKKKMAELQKDLALLLTPLMPDKKQMNHRLLENLKLLTQKQADSLEFGASKWVQDRKSNPNEARSPFTVWLGNKLIAVPPKQMPEEFGYDFEEADLEFEQLKEIEAENVTKDDEDFESLHGVTLAVADNFTCREIPGLDNSKVKDILKQQDMWKIPEASRGAVYRYLQSEMKASILSQFRDLSQKYNGWAVKRRIGQFEKDENILKKQKLIGMTTTGFSKYRGLISALRPKIVLVEEAAEILEAPVAVTCVPSLQHLILVGDHQQLRPHTHVKGHENEPFHLNMSLFERLVNNKLKFDTLLTQRRMIPEIRRVLYPIYKDKIQDHSSVLDPKNRPNVRGMGGVNSFFFSHQWSEQRDDHMSCFNPREADMVVGLVEHLVCNEENVDDITVLTFYNGQRKRILAELRKRPVLEHIKKFNVVTVDSYQGEENKIVILSLVRSNTGRQIGFLNVDNRVCVALSRAQCGFYIFGNGQLLHDNSKTWYTVTRIMAGDKNKKERPVFQPHRLGEQLPIRCSNHNTKVEISEPEDWEDLYGGCKEKCSSMLSCGHACPLPCHPFGHHQVTCQDLQCKAARKRIMEGTHLENIPNGNDVLRPRISSGSKSTESSWNSYAAFESKRAADLDAAYVPRSQRGSPQKSVDESAGVDSVIRGLEQLSTVALNGSASSPSHTVVSTSTDSRGRVTQVFKTAVVGEEKDISNEEDPKEELLIDFS